MISFPSLCSFPACLPAFPVLEVTERGGLAHQPNASLIVQWVSVGEHKGSSEEAGATEGGPGGIQGSVVSQRQRLMVERRAAGIRLLPLVTKGRPKTPAGHRDLHRVFHLSRATFARRLGKERVEGKGQMVEGRH